MAGRLTPRATFRIALPEAPPGIGAAIRLGIPDWNRMTSPKARGQIPYYAIGLVVASTPAGAPTG